MDASRLDKPSALLARLVTAAAVVAVLAWLAVVAARIGHPYELEWMEGGSVDHVRRLLAGLPLYGPPSLTFTPFIYPPLYFALAALVARATGLGFLPLRLVSLAAALGVLALTYAFVARESGRRGAGLLAVGLFTATFAASGGWFDLGRVDTLCLALTLAGAYLLRFAPGWRGQAAAGACLALACFTKQTALVFAAPLLLQAVLARRRRALAALAPFAILVVGGTVLLDRASDGWFSYYLWRLPAGHRLLRAEVTGFWFGDLLPCCAVALLLAVPTLRADLRRDRGGARGFLVALAAGLLAGAWLSRVHDGGWLNVLMPAHAALAIAGALGAGRLLRGARPARANLIHLACLLQFLLLAYNPHRFMPSPADRAAGDRLVRDLAALPGPAFVPQHGWLATLAGKQAHAHGQALLDVLRGRDAAGARALRGELAAALAARRYAGVVLDDAPALVTDEGDQDWLERELSAGYAPTGRLDFADGELMPRVGKQTRPATIWTPRPPADAP